MHLLAILEATGTKDDAIHWARTNGLLRRSIDCSLCQTTMVIISTNEAPDFESFRCQKCHKKNSIRTGSITFNSKLPLQTLIRMIYFWSDCTTNKRVQRELELTDKTVSNWFQNMRQICKLIMDDVTGNQMLGGANMTVEVDESVITKRKYNRGRLVPQVWIFGGIERRTTGRQRRFIEFVENRKETTLLASIHRNILPGATIISDG